MPTTTNFGWTTPADTDLVKDGAAAIRTLGNGVDSSFLDLKGGTSGQILSKNSNTDLDFVWIANDQGDITAVTAGTGISGGGTSGAVTITNSMATEITASGDIIVGTGSGTFDNLPIGSTGQVLTADTSVSPYKVKWAAVASGGMTLLSTTTLSGASTTISNITQDYVTLIAHIENATNATADGLLNINPNSATQAHQISINGYNTTVSTSAQTGVEINTRKALAKGASEASLILRIDNYTLTTCPKPFHFYGHFITTDSERGTINAAGGVINSPYAAITSLVFSNAGGNFTGGTVRLYGVK